MKTSKRIIFIHGNDTMRWSHSFAPWLKMELDKLKIENVFETFPDSIIGRRKYWIPFLDEKLGADENTILVGESTGAIASMRYAENHKLFGSALVSGYYTDLGDAMEKQSGYFDDPWHWDKIKHNQKFIGLFYSQDDPFIPQTEFSYLIKKLSPEVFAFKNRGHFLDQKKFPELLNFIKKKLS